MKLRQTHFLSFLLALFLTHLPLHLQGDDCYCEKKGFEGTFIGEGRVTTDIIIAVVDKSGIPANSTETITLKRPYLSGAQPLRLEHSMMVPPSGEIEISFTGTGTFGIRFHEKMLIKRSTESIFRLGDYIPMDGYAWRVKRRHPYLRSTDNPGRFAPDLPALSEGKYTSYGSQKTPTLSYLIALGEGGGFLEMGGTVASGGTAHSRASLRYYPGEGSPFSSHYPSTNPYQFMRRDYNSYAQVLFEATDVGTGYEVKAYDATSLGQGGTFPIYTSALPVLETFKIETVTAGTGYNYAVKLSRDASNYTILEADTNGANTRVTHVSPSLGSVIDETTTAVVSPTRTVQRIRKQTSGSTTTLSDVVETYKIIGGVEQLTSRDRNLPAGESSLATDYFYEESIYSSNYAKLDRIEERMASTLIGWTKYGYDYSLSSEYTIHAYTPWKDNPLSAPASPDPLTHPGKTRSMTYEEASTSHPARVKQSVDRVNAVIIGKVVNTYSFDLTHDVTVSQRYVNATTYLETTTKNWPRDPASTANDFKATLVYSVKEPGNITERTDHTLNTTNPYHTKTDVADWVEPLISGKTKKTTRTIDRWGQKDKESVDLRIGTSYVNAYSQSFAYDSYGRATSVSRGGKTLWNASYTGVDVVAETDLHGVKNTRTYDRLGRVISDVEEGASSAFSHPALGSKTTTYTYNGLTTTETVSAGGMSLTTTTVADRTGRPKSIADPQGLVTTYSYTPLTAGTSMTVTGPNGTTETRQTYLDGQRRLVTGTGVVAQAFDYTTSGDKLYTKSVTGSTSVSGSRWTATYEDWAGRTTNTTQPGPNGNIVHDYLYYSGTTSGGGGRLRSITPTGATTLKRVIYDYDAHGNLFRTANDADGSGGIGTAGTDRIVEQDTVHELVGSDYYEITREWVYDTNSSSNKRKISESGTRINGDPYNSISFQKDYTDNAGLYGTHTQRTHTILDRNLKTAQDATIVSRLENDAVSYPLGYTAYDKYLNNLLVSSSTTTVSAPALFTFDDLRRPIKESNPRTSTVTTTTYYTTTAGAGDYKGRVKTVSDALGNMTTYEYYKGETWHICPPGSLKGVKNAAAKYTYYSYNRRGETTHIWGHTEYPVMYLYNNYGDQTDMRTYRGGSGWTNAPASGAAVPAAFSSGYDQTTWNYHAGSGLLTTKTDAAAKSVTYSYHTATDLVNVRTWARGGTSTYAYNFAGDNTGITYSNTNTPNVSFTYERDGRLKTVTDAAGLHTFTETESSGEKTFTEAISGTGTLSGYEVAVKNDRYGRRSALTGKSPGANTFSAITYSYYATADRLSTVNELGGLYATYTYATNSDRVTTAVCGSNVFTV